jgi:glucose-6-phosphate isomerase
MLAPLEETSQSAQDILQLRRQFFSGEKINTSEDRAAGHWALRASVLSEQPSHAAPIPGHFSPDGHDLMPGMRAVHGQSRTIAQRIRSRVFCASSGQPFEHVLHLGIGGSGLGPRLLTDALADETDATEHSPSPHFLSNLDAHGVLRVLKKIDPKATLVILVSKSFTTQETLRNAALVRDWMADAGLTDCQRDFIAITAAPHLAKAWGVSPEQILSFDQTIGGRYSLWGPVSLTARICLGNELIDRFLAGGLEMDEHFLTSPPRLNLPMVLAASDFYNFRIRRLPTLMVSAYDSRLSLLVPYLQQLWMESLGKHVGPDGLPNAAPACPILWGDIGTDAQHAFFQLLHQGGQGCAIDLIGVINPSHEAREHHQALLANLLAQSQALSLGQSFDRAEQNCLGGHPVHLMLMDRLDAQCLGRLIALWEHRVLVLAALTRVNPFDQWGVEVGKVLATHVCAALKNESDTAGQTSRPEPITAQMGRSDLDDITQEAVRIILKTTDGHGKASGRNEG